MTETREVETAVLASITSGIVLAEWSKVREITDFIMDDSVTDIAFIIPEFVDELRKRILSQYPWLPKDGDVPEFVGPDKQAALLTYLDAFISQHTSKVFIKSGPVS